MIKEFIGNGFTGIHTGVIPECLDRKFSGCKNDMK
jgi:hypothetical protein